MPWHCHKGVMAVTGADYDDFIRRISVEKMLLPHIFFVVGQSREAFPHLKRSIFSHIPTPVKPPPNPPNSRYIMLLFGALLIFL